MPSDAETVEREGKIFDMCLDEACRQWCCFIDEAPERKSGEGFADFFKEIYEEKSQEYRSELTENESEESDEVEI